MFFPLPPQAVWPRVGQPWPCHGELVQHLHARGALPSVPAHGQSPVTTGGCTGLVRARVCVS